MYKLIKGTDLTNEQKRLLKFKGMNNLEWVISHSFYFTADGTTPAPINSDCYYPICNSLNFLPY